MKNTYNLITIFIIFVLLSIVMINTIDNYETTINNYESVIDLSAKELEYTNLLVLTLNQSNIIKDKELIAYQNNLTEQTKLKEFYIQESKYYASLDNKLAMNPRWSDVQSFIKKDKTDKNIYDIDTYDCTAFSNELIKSAIENNIFMCSVEINWDDDIGHMMVAVNTSDKGLVYIEPQSDTVIDLHLGKDGHSELSNETVISYESCFERIKW